MDRCEIKSPEEPPQPQGTSSMSRKKLGIYFIESEDRRMAFGRGYTAGSTPVDIHGKSIVDLSKTGGWIAAFFIFGIYRVLIHNPYSLYIIIQYTYIYVQLGICISITISFYLINEF